MADQIDSSEIRISGPALTRRVAGLPIGDGRKPASPLDGINATARWSASYRPRFVTRWWTGSPVLSRTSPENERLIGARQHP
jgi:hypothetical protein